MTTHDSAFILDLTATRGRPMATLSPQEDELELREWTTWLRIRSDVTGFLAPTINPDDDELTGFVPPAFEDDGLALLAIARSMEDFSGEVQLTIYEPADPQAWAGRCETGAGRELETSERGTEICTLALLREGDKEHPVWAGTSKPGDCKRTREGDAYMTTQMRIDAEGVDIWERGFDESGNQTWGPETPTHYEPAAIEWPKPP